MALKVRFRQYAISIAVFAIVLGGLVSIDERVRDRFTAMVHGDDALTPWGDRVSDLGGALMTAIRTQSIENAPLIIFATAGGVLFLFMFRT
jgi:hypothetical protein